MSVTYEQYYGKSIQYPFVSPIHVELSFHKTQSVYYGAIRQVFKTHKLFFHKHYCCVESIKQESYVSN